MTMTTKARSNKFAADCADCGRRVPAAAGRLVQQDGEWLVFCADRDDCHAARDARQSADVDRHAAIKALAQAEFDRRVAAGDTDPDCIDIMCWAQDQIPADKPAPKTPARRNTRTASPAKRRASTSRRRKACVTGGNCSSHSGVSCGGWNCDANAN